MKKLVLVCTILAALFCSTTHATIWRVNGNPNIDADFHDLQAAIDDPYVFPYDTLYVEGYSNSYGSSIAVNKPLVLIGTGYFLNENDTTQAIKLQSWISSIYFQAGSEGSELTGFYIHADYGNLVVIETYGITISNNRIYSQFNYNYGNIQGITIIGTGPDPIVIAKNYIYCRNTAGGGYSDAWGIRHSDGIAANVVIKNNYIAALAGWTERSIQIYKDDPANQIVIFNNVLVNDLLCQYGSVYNNIMVEGSLSGNYNIYEYNIGNGTQFPAGNGNQQNVNMALVFINHNSGIDNGLKLSPVSPAKGAGMNGTDCGMFGGNTPYVLSGIPEVPSIFEIDYTGVGSASVPIQVNLKAKSNK